MLLTNHMRISELIQRKCEIQNKLREAKVYLNELKRYAECIADGKVSIFDMLNTPTSMFPRIMMYNQYSARYCKDSADFQLNELVHSPYYNNVMTLQPNFAQNQGVYQEMMRQSFYQEAQKQFAKYEAQLLHEKETEASERSDSLKTELEAINAELEGLKKERSEEIKQVFSTQA